MCERVGEDATEAGERDRERDGVMKCDTERVGRGWSCSCVSAHEGCTISAAAQVKLDSNPRIKNLCWFAKPDYWHFPTFLYCHPTVRWPLHALNFCHLQRKWPPAIYLFIYAYTNVFSVINTQGRWTVKREKKGVWAEEYWHPHRVFTARLSYLPWGSPCPLSWHSNHSSAPGSPSKFRACIVLERITTSFKVIRNHYHKPSCPCD